MSAVATSFIQKTPGVCGGDACIRSTRIPVWIIVLGRRLGRTDDGQLEDYPTLTQADLDVCWEYYRENPVEIEQSIWFNDTAGNVPNGAAPLPWVIITGRMLGISDHDICEAFDPPITTAQIDTAWAAYRADPAALSREIAAHRLAG